MKTLITPTKAQRKPRASKWIPRGVQDALITKKEADSFTDGLLKIAARVEGLPADFAQNHDHYIHGLPKK